MERFGKHWWWQWALPATSNLQVWRCKNTEVLWHIEGLTCSSTAYSRLGIREEGSLPTRSSTHPEGRQLLVCKTGSAGRERNKKGVCRLGDPSGCFQWAENLKGHFLAEGRPWLSKVPTGDWCFCKPQSCRELLEETARLEERLQPEKILAGGSGSYIFIFNKFASASRSDFSVGKIHLIPFSIFCVLINYCMRV